MEWKKYSNNKTNAAQLMHLNRSAIEAKETKLNWCTGCCLDALSYPQMLFLPTVLALSKFDLDAFPLLLLGLNSFPFLFVSNHFLLVPKHPSCGCLVVNYNVNSEVILNEDLYLLHFDFSFFPSCGLYASYLGFELFFPAACFTFTNLFTASQPHSWTLCVLNMELLECAVQHSTVWG